MELCATDTSGDNWQEMLVELPRPWNVAFTRRYLQQCRIQCSAEKIAAPAFNAYTNPWFATLPTLALALPSTCFDDALQPWDVPEGEGQGWQMQYAREQLRAFTETIHLRQKIYEEII